MAARSASSAKPVIGVLAVQGDFREHLDTLETIGATGREVRLPADLLGLSGLILPGGESTAMRKLLHRWDLVAPIRDLAARGAPILGTCAGAIILANRIADGDEPVLSLLDVEVRRNAFGRQLESFEADLQMRFRGGLVALGVSPGEYRRHGCFAEKIALPTRILYRIPEALSYEKAAFAEPVSIGAMVGPDAFFEVRYLQHHKQLRALELIPQLAMEFKSRFGRDSGGLIRSGALEVIASSGRRFCVGDGAGKRIRVRFVDAAAEWRLLRDPELALGEIYTDGGLVVEAGDICDVAELGLRNFRNGKDIRWMRFLDRMRTALRRLDQRNDSQRAQKNVAHHYDIDARLYALFLDSDRQYSCAYFETPDQSLDDAQLAKKRHIVAKLNIEPGHRVLDIGSGWGGLGLYIARHCKADVVGVTLSEEQLAASRMRAASEDLQRCVDFRLVDYRSLDEKFDRIVSVGRCRQINQAVQQDWRRTAFARQLSPPVVRAGIKFDGVRPLFNAPVSKWPSPGWPVCDFRRDSPSS